MATARGLGLGAVGLSAGWQRLWVGVPDADGAPVVEAPARRAPSGPGALLVAPSGMHLALLAPERLDQAEAVAVRLPGTEALPPALRWMGVRAVPLQAGDATGDALIGIAGQVWLQQDGGLASLGGLSGAAERLPGAGGVLAVRPELDWTVGDLAALCAARGCAIRPRAAAGPPAAPGRAGLP